MGRWDHIVEVAILGGIPFTKDFGKGHMESYYSRSILKKYTHINISRKFKWNYSIISCLNRHHSIMPPPDTVGNQIKISAPGIGFLISSFWLVESSQTLQTLSITCEYGPALESKTLLLKYHRLAHRTWENQTNTGLETLLVLASFPRAGRFILLVQKSNQQFYSSVNYVNHSNWFGKTCPVVKKWR